MPYINIPPTYISFGWETGWCPIVAEILSFYHLLINIYYIYIFVLLSVITLPLITTHNGDGKFQIHDCRTANLSGTCSASSKLSKPVKLHGIRQPKVKCRTMRARYTRALYFDLQVIKYVSTLGTWVEQQRMPLGNMKISGRRATSQFYYVIYIYFIIQFRQHNIKVKVPLHVST